MLNPDGSGLRKFGTPDAWEVSPYWAPDGSTIAFDSKAKGNYDLALLNPTSGEITILTATPGDEGEPRWTPDGKTLVFDLQNPHTSLVTVGVDKLLSR